MQVFKAFFKILNKNKLSMLIYMGIFFALTIVMSRSGAENDMLNFSQVSLKIGIDNQDKGELGEALAEYLSGENKIKEVPKEREELLDEMYYQNMDYVLVIPETFTEKFLAGEREDVLMGTKVPGSDSSYLAETEVQEFLKTLGMYIDGGYEAGKAVEQTLLDMHKESRVEFLSSKDAQEKPGGYYYFQYIPYIFLSIMIVGLSVVLMAFNEKNVEARNKCSAMSFAKRNFQMILGSVCLMIVECLVFAAAACVMYPEFMGGVRGVLSTLNALVYGLVCLSIAFFVGRLAKNTSQLNMIANVIGLGFSFLGGVFVPLEVMSEGVKTVAKFVPSYWYILSNEAIWKMENFKDAGDIFINFLVMGAFAVAVLAMAMMVNRLKAREG